MYGNMRGYFGICILYYDWLYRAPQVAGRQFFTKQWFVAWNQRYWIGWFMGHGNLWESKEFHARKARVKAFVEISGQNPGIFLCL